jgi:hypothetical protein
MKNRVATIGGQTIYLKKASPSFLFMGSRLRGPVTKELFKTKKKKLQNLKVILKTRMYL